jgi:hypothetical protein
LLCSGSYLLTSTRHDKETYAREVFRYDKIDLMAADVDVSFHIKPKCVIQIRDFFLETLAFAICALIH